MAASSNTLTFTLLGKDKLGPAFDSAGKRADGLGAKFGAAGKVASVGLAAAVAGTAAMAAGFGIAVQKAIPFDKSIRKVGAIANVSGKGLKELSNLAIKMGQDTVFSASEAAGAMVELAKGGFTVAQIKAGALEGTLTLATAGELEMGAAATFLSNTLNTFGLTAKDSNRAVAALAGGANASSASVESLGMALGQVGPGAKLAGQSIESTVAVLAAFDNAGIKGSDAGTSLKTMFMRLIPTTKKAAGEMADLGLKFSDSQGKILPLRDIAGQLQTKLGGLSMAQKQTALTTIFGSDAFRAAAVLADLGAAGVDKYTSATSDLTAAQKLAKVGVEGAAGAWEQFTGSVDTLAVTLGIRLLPAFTSVTNFVTKKVLPLADRAITSFAGFAEGIAPPIKVAFTTAGEEIGKVAKTWGPKISKELEKADLTGVARKFATQAKTWSQSIIGGVKLGLDTGDWSALGESVGSGIAEAINSIGSAVGKLTKAFLGVLSKVDWVGIGIGLGKQAPALVLGVAVGILNVDLLGLLKGLAAHWQEVILGVLFVAFAPAKFIAGISKALARIPFVGRLLSWGFDVFAKFSKGLVGMVGRALGFIGRAFMDGFRLVFPGVGKGFGKALGLLPTWLGVVAINLAAGARKMMLGLAGAIGKGIAWVVGKIGQLIGLMLKPFAKAGGWLLRHGANLVLGLLRGILSVSRTIGRWILTNVVRPVISPFARAGSWLVNAGSNAVTGLKRGVLGVARTLGRWVLDNVALPTIRVFARAGEWLLNTGTNLLTGLKRGILDAMASIGTWLKTHLVDPIIGRVKGFFGITSPSKVFAGMGANMVKGLFQGLGSVDMGKAIGRIFGSMPDALGAIVGKGLVALSKLPKRALDALSGAAGGVLGLAPGGYEKTVFRGKFLNEDSVKRILAAEKILGRQFRITQGSYSSSVAASGTTHMGGGAFDVDDAGVGWSRAVAALRAVGIAAWHRTPAQGPWGPHIHGIALGDPTASMSAKAQMRSFRAGGTGLAGYRLGTRWVPDDQLAFLHRGEAVIPADVNRAMTGGIDYDKLADAIAKAIGSGRPLQVDNHFPASSGAAAREAADQLLAALEGR